MTHTLGATAFDVCGELPTGTTVLEASAGTGKTFTIAALAARYVAEGHAKLPELMLVTFGRNATRELRERVRDRLVAAERGLLDPSTARAGDDEILRLLASVPDDEVLRRRRRLADALAQFDAATIATTHQFCQQMLAGLGIAGGADPDAVFVENTTDLVDEVVDDFYVRRYAAPAAGEPHFDRAQAGKLALRAVEDGQARLEPVDAPEGSAAQVRFRFAGAVRAEVERRKAARRVYTYDDMLTRLRDALTDPVTGAAACDRLRERYRVVLVDEFQDTDPVQWEILDRAFHGHTTLVLIGDPKQAIYAFRGADVISYLQAAQRADHHATLAVNWRSDKPLLAALDELFGGAALGDERIVVRPVEAAHSASRLQGAPPMRLRVLGRSGLQATQYGMPRVAGVRPRIATDMARDVVALLSRSDRLVDSGESRPVRPGDIAVLVRTNLQGDLCHDALQTAGVPAVLTGSSSVFLTPTAGQWLTLLEAVEQPQRASRVRAAALTCFIGHSVADLVGEDDRVVEQVGLRLREWQLLLAARGVAAMVEAVTSGTGLPQRMLSLAGGERELTDVRHIGQSLQIAATEGHLGPTALVMWLRHRIDEALAEQTVERSRRLESDADAVQIVTVHRAKGLEFPIVYVPFGWDNFVGGEPDLLRLHEGTTRVLDVGGSDSPGYRSRLARHHAEDLGEDLRLLYVALTRARSQVVTWWAPSTTTKNSALHRLLFGATGPGCDPDAGPRIPNDDAAWERLQRLRGITVERVTRSDTVRWSPASAEPVALAGARFDRTLDTAWRRTSYTALTAGSHAPGVGSEPEADERDDEPAVEAAEFDPSAEVPSPMAELPSGTGFGTLVHSVFENVDFAAADLTAELGAACAAQLARRPSLGLDAGPLAEALMPSLLTPLGPLVVGKRLRDIGSSDRLTELDFELPLAGGDHADGVEMTLGAAAELMRRHGDDLGYADVLAGPDLAGQRLRGYLNGSIDAVLRVNGRFVVVDYKTNWLGPIGPSGPEPLFAGHYGAPALREAMVAADYPLQALLYSVALHRFLRWRVASYDPAVHLGGVLYLFLRGMCGPDTPVVVEESLAGSSISTGVPCGVFSWRPAPELVASLSDLLDGRASS